MSSGEEHDVAEEDAPRPETPEDYEYLRMMYAQHAQHARSHEELRGAATGFIVALLAVILGYAAAQKSALPLGVSGLLAVATSVLGILVSRKHYERFKFHCAEMVAFRSSIEANISKELKSIRENAEAKHNRLYPKTSDQSLHDLWEWVFWTAGAAGIGITILAILAGDGSVKLR